MVTEAAPREAVGLHPFALQYLELEELWLEACSSHPIGLAYTPYGMGWVVGQLARVGESTEAMRRLALHVLKSEQGVPRDGAVGAFVGPLGRAVAAASLAPAVPEAAEVVHQVLAEEAARYRTAQRATDLFHGAAGAVVALHGLVPAYPEAGPLLERRVAELRQGLLSPRGPDARTLGLAHGVAGELLAMEVAERHQPWALRGEWRGEAVAVLREAADPQGRWEHTTDRLPTFQGWCNGTPGVVLGLCLAGRVSDGDAYDALARSGAAYLDAVDWDEASVSRHYCCGLLGLVDTYLELFRRLGRPEHLHRARALHAAVDPVDLASARGADDVQSLHQGLLGWAYLGARCRWPDALPPIGLGWA